jgi:ABC-type transport system substrate-binding protein
VTGILFLCLIACGCREKQPSISHSARQLVMTAPRIAGFDPVRSGDAASASAYALVYEGLLQLDPVSPPYRLRPALAEALPEISDDQQTLRFRIRKGIHFSDDPCFRESGGKGREVVARDFVYSILRVADSKNASPGYWAFRNRIAGLDAFRARSAESAVTDYDEPVEGLSAPDRYTLEIRLLRPYPQLQWILAMHYAYVVPREAVETYDAAFVNHPVGTGAFVLEGWRRNYRMTFVRNPKWEQTGRREPFPDLGAAAPADFTGADTGRTVPGLDRLIQLVVSDASTQWQMFLSGGLAFSGVSRDNWDAVMDSGGGLSDAMRKRGIRLAIRPSLDLYYIGFNMEDPVVGTNRALRQAMACAFNAAEWAAFYNGQVTRPTAPIPPGVSGYSPLPELYPFDLVRARALLIEAGYPGGVDPATGRRLQLTLELADPDNPDVRQSTDLFVQFMDRIGLTLRPSYNSRPAFFDKLAHRRAQIFRLSWIADYPDAQNFLQLFVSAHASPGSNRANYKNPEVDALYARMEAMPDGPARTEICASIARLVMEDCPWILTHSPMAPVLVHETVGGYVTGPFTYGFEKYLFIRAGQP